MIGKKKTLDIYSIYPMSFLTTPIEKTPIEKMSPIE